MSSRLFQRVREQNGMTYSIYSYLSTSVNSGMLTIYAGMNPLQANTVFDLIIDEINKLKNNGITKKEFIVPTYYKNFACKCGDCRTPCCGGWSVTVSMSEYFNLLSLDCSEELRHKINCALCINNGDSESAYARLTPSWLGTCHLQREDGLCAVHAECGEWSLPNICRVYPRCARDGEVLRLCCSSSCEKTVELFMEQKEPMDFERASFALDAYMDDGMTEDEFAKQMEYVKILQNRQISVENRLFELYKYMFGKELSKDVSERINALKVILDYYEAHSDSIAAICEKYEMIKNQGKLKEAIDALEQKYPDFEILVEHLLVNHVFYSAFPMGEKRISEEGAFWALCVVYSLTKLFAAVAIFEADDADIKVLISDAVSAFYRLCEHSAFAYNSMVLLKRAGYLSEECIKPM